MAENNLEEATNAGQRSGGNPLAVVVAVLLVLSLGVAVVLGNSFDVQGQARATILVVLAALCGWAPCVAGRAVALVSSPRPGDCRLGGARVAGGPFPRSGTWPGLT